ncbi:hypothetical protein BJV82DRAFT_663193 [Fennellomyces sp. T-0311]|nr:hypothetical protein BJV82DRAFT_663193 [Fennellomyces sp. T-0311]
MSTAYGQVRYTQHELKCRSAAGQQLMPSQIMHGISNEIVQNRNYTAGEELFQDLVRMLKSKRAYQNMDIASFQKSIAKLVRFAPNGNKLMYYAGMLLNDFWPPLRDERIENTILIDIIKLYGRWRGEYWTKGLDFVKIGVERGLGVSSNRMHFFQQEDVFESACMPILRYHGLCFSRDGLSLEKRPPRP